jgi:hypothetical protein
LRGGRGQGVWVWRRAAVTAAHNPSKSLDDGPCRCQPAVTWAGTVISHSFTAMMEQRQEGYVASIAASAGRAVEFTRHDLYGLDALIIRQIDQSREEVSAKTTLKNTTLIKPDPVKPDFSYQFQKREHRGCARAFPCGVASGRADVRALADRARAAAVQAGDVPRS